MDGGDRRPCRRGRGKAGGPGARRRRPRGGVRAAQAAGFRRSETIHGIRVEGSDKPGLGGKIARTLAETGISFRGMQASVIGRNFLSFIALDTAEDAAKAMKVLRKL